MTQDMGPEGLDIETMVGHIVRAAIRVPQAQSAASHAIAAYEAATQEHNRGPALLVVPIERGRSTTSEPPPVVRSITATKTTVPHESVRTAAQWLAEAERPLIVLGSGCDRSRKQMRRLVDALNVPFVTTPTAKGLVSERHPRSLRNAGMAASVWARSYTKMGVDVALVLGTDLDDTAVCSTPYLRPGGRLIHVDLDARVFHRNLPAELPVVADVGAFAEALARHATEAALINVSGGELCRAVRAESPFDQPDAANDASETVAPHRAILDLERAAGLDAMFITDIGEHMLFALHYLTARTPESFHIQLGLGSMGSGIAGAIGLALGKPGKRIVCICGDGGMHMTGMEMLVAADRGLPIVYAVFNDARYNMVYHGMKQIFGRGAAWETPWVDFAAWSRAMGVPAVRINHPGEITAEVLDTMSENGPGPMLLDIRIDREVRIRGGGRVEALQQMSMGTTEEAR